MPKKVGERIDHEHAVTGEKLALMAVLANPQEEAFGPAGTLARYASEGVRVSVVTVTRERASAVPVLTQRAAPPLVMAARDKSCSCLASGAHRICLLDYAGGRIDLDDETRMEERLVRLMREQRPQVIVTYGPEGLGDASHPLISHLTTRAFQIAGDSTTYPEHLADGLTAFQPRKLYYTVLPQNVAERWGLEHVTTVSDDEATTIVDVSHYNEAKLSTLYCQRDHSQDYARWLGARAGLHWEQEYFVLAASHLRRKTRKENDLFAGLR